MKHYSDEQIAELHDGELLCSEMRQHLATCSECSAKLNHLVAIKKALPLEPVASTSFTESVMYSIEKKPSLTFPQFSWPTQAVALSISVLALNFSLTYQTNSTSTVTESVASFESLLVSDLDDYISSLSSQENEFLDPILSEVEL